MYSWTVAQTGLHLSKVISCNTTELGVFTSPLYQAVQLISTRVEQSSVIQGWIQIPREPRNVICGVSLTDPAVTLQTKSGRGGVVSGSGSLLHSWIGPWMCRFVFRWRQRGSRRRRVKPSAGRPSDSLPAPSVIHAQLFSGNQQNLDDATQFDKVRVSFVFCTLKVLEVIPGTGGEN